MPIADILPFRRTQPPIIDPRIQAKNRAVWTRFAAPVKPTTGMAHAYSARVHSLHQESSDTVSLLLDLNGASLTWRPGQFITCRVNVNNDTLQRAYSISNCGTLIDGNAHLCRSQLVRITVKHVDGGQVSSAINSTFSSGDQIEFTGPHGDFCASKSPSTKLFVAGGAGITPILPLIQTHLTAATGQPCALIYSTQKKQDAIFYKALTELANNHSNFSLHWVETGGKPTRRLTAERLENVLADLPWLDSEATEVFLCGPDGLNTLSQQVFTTKRWTKSLVHTERFLSNHHNAANHSLSAQEIEFPQWHKHVIAQPDQSLLEAGLSAGIAMPHSCQVGGCGHCKVKVVKGNVISDEPNCLSAEESAQGYRLACVSYATSPVTLEIEGEQQ